MLALSHFIIFALGSLFFLKCVAKAPSGPWDTFNFAPKSKTVYATGIFGTGGKVSDPQNLLHGSHGSTTLTGNLSWVTLDFGVEVGGLISIDIQPPNATSGSSSTSLHLSFSESPAYIRPLLSDDSNYPDPSTAYDCSLTIPSPLPSGHWTQPAFSLRGGFRYLTLTLVTSSAAEEKEKASVALGLSLSNVSCAISFMPHVDDLRAYTGYFYAKDPVMHDPDFLTKIWYAGAYTVQTNTVAVNTGRFGHGMAADALDVHLDWENNGTLGVAGPIIVDGAKRDRAVWPGDMGIAVPTQFVSTYDMLPTKNALATMFSNINPVTGALPESGPPLSQLGSDTYHAWTLIGTYNYHLYTGDDAFLKTIWTNYTKAVAFLEGKVLNVTLSDGESVRLMNVTGLRDWARQAQGGFNAEGNAILYKVLTSASSLSSSLSLPTLSLSYTRNASTLKTSFNHAFWVPSSGMYKDNITDTTLCPQDANSFAVVFGLTDTDDKPKAISEGLQRNWGEYGAEAPELPGTVSPFVGGFKLQAHFIAGNDDAAMEMLRTEWGHMLYTNLSVQSTLLEGYTTNGSLSYRSQYGYNYDPAYTSHAHGWSTSPTSTLTTYILGLTITSPNGLSWSLAPHPSGLDEAQGGFETGLGWFGASWFARNRTIEVQAPGGTSGEVVIPGEWSNGEEGEVQVNGRVVQGLSAGGRLSVGGGTHRIVVG